MTLETAEIIKGLMESVKTHGNAISTNTDSMEALLAMIKGLAERVKWLEKKANGESK